MKKNKTAKKNAAKISITEAQSARIMAAIERGDTTITLTENVCKACGGPVSKDYEKCYACRFYGKKSFALKRNK